MAGGWGRRRGLVPALLLAVLVAAPSPARGEDQEGCLSCHGLPGFGYTESGTYHSLEVPAEDFNTSSHGGLGCRGCHRGITSVPHGAAAEKVNCGLDCHAADSETGQPYSHEALYWTFMGSVHAKGPRAFGCRVCHPLNEPPREPSGAKLEGAKQCLDCHAAGGRSRRYFSDVHGKLVAAGSRLAPSCRDCHTQHAVQPSGLQDSTTSRQRVARTCAGSEAGEEEKGCHREAGTAFQAGMSPLAGPGWRRLPAGGGFWWLGVALAAMLVARTATGLGRRR